MLAFFRKIRQKLFQSKRISQYLLYAIGEIALVMIGILLAIQVNSYYQSLQERKLEKSVLLELAQSIHNDSILLQMNVSVHKKIKEDARYLDSMISNRLPYTKKIDSAFGSISAFIVSEANYIPFDKVKSLKSGIIQNDSLYNSLARYYNFSKFLTQVDRYFQNGAYFRHSIYPKYFKGYRYGTIAEVVDYQQILESSEIKVAIDYCYNDANYYYRNSQRRVEGATSLIKAIKKELQRFKD